MIAKTALKQIGHSARHRASAGYRVCNTHAFQSANDVRKSKPAIRAACGCALCRTRSLRELDGGGLHNVKLARSVKTSSFDEIREHFASSFAQSTNAGTIEGKKANDLPKVKILVT